MTEPNQATIDAYNKEADKYILKTPHDYQDYHKPMLEWIDAALEGLRGNAVLEIGSATPRDATYIRKKGFAVQTSDASQCFVDLLKKSNEHAVLFNVLHDPLPGKYNLVFANAVAPHFTPSDLIKFLDRISASLSTGDRIAFNLKLGTGENWINEKLTAKRFIHYWNSDDIKVVLSRYKLKIVFFESNVAGDLPNHHWANIVVEK